MELTKHVARKPAYASFKSIINLFLYTFIVAFINHELFYQSQAQAKPKGFIYNKDGKFIYRSPKSGQGSLIVIDERHRDPSNYHRDEVTTAQSSFSAYPLVSQQQIYRPDLAIAAQGRSMFNPVDQVQTIQFIPQTNDLQSLRQLPAMRLSYPVPALTRSGSSIMQRPPPNSGLLQVPISGNSPIQPIFQLVQPQPFLAEQPIKSQLYVDDARSRPSNEYELFDQNHHSNLFEMQTNQRHHPAHHAQRSQFSESETQIKAIESLPYGYSETDFVDDIQSGRQIIGHGSRMSSVGSLDLFQHPNALYNSLVDDQNKAYLDVQDDRLHQKHDPMMQLFPNGAHQLEPSQRSLDWRSKHTGDPVERNGQRQRKDVSKIKGNLQSTKSMNFSLKGKSSELLDPKDQKGGRYWRQFKDDFDLIQ